MKFQFYTLENLSHLTWKMLLDVGNGPTCQNNNIMPISWHDFSQSVVSNKYKEMDMYLLRLTGPFTLIVD